MLRSSLLLPKVALSLLIPSFCFAVDTTDNLIDNSEWTFDGDIDFWQSGADSVIWVYSNTEATVSQVIDLSQYEFIGDIRYGMSAYGCNNTPSGAWCEQTADTSYYDTLTVTVNYGNNTYTDTVTLNYNDYFVDYDFSFTATEDYTTATISFTSQDPGGWDGYFASATTDVYFNLDYNTYTEMLVTDPALDDIINPDFSDIAIDPVADIGIDPSMDVGVDTTMPSLDPIVVEIDMPGMDTTMDAPMDMADMSMPDMEIAPMDSPEMSEEVVVEIEMSDQQPTPEMAPAEQRQEPEVAQEQSSQEPDAKVEQAQSEQQESDSSSSGSSETKSNVITITEMSMQQVAANFDSAYDAQAQAVAIAVMSMSAPSYEAVAQLQDAEFYDIIELKETNKLKDRLWGAIYLDDKKWNEMVDEQYEYRN